MIREKLAYSSGRGKVLARLDKLWLAREKGFFNANQSCFVVNRPFSSFPFLSETPKKLRGWQ